jgi:alkylation response protein AidB-like acyl-CoA dehydrogenase
VDESGEFPWDVHDALARAELTAVHIPEAYGRSGADAIATAIVIEEVARACASSSLIPAVNKLGTGPAGAPGRRSGSPAEHHTRHEPAMLG